MLITCPSCAGRFELDEPGAKATALCPLCGRVVVVRDAALVPEAKEGGTVPFDPGTEAALEPLTAADELTAVGGRGPKVALPAGKRISLAILSGPRKGDVMPIEAPRVTLGRSGGGADVEVDDSEVSRAHATLECVGGRFVLTDTGSTNGTFVAEERVQAREIEDKGEFRLGHTRFLLMVNERG
jgi:hypothetical protein